MLEGLLPGGATGALSTLSTMETWSKRAPRLVRTAAPKEWPPMCESGLCGTQGCVCRRLARRREVESRDVECEISVACPMNEFRFMLEPQTPEPVSKASQASQASPTRTVVKRGRGRPRKRSRLLAKAPTLPMGEPPVLAACTNLVDGAIASLRAESLSPDGRMGVKKIEPLLRTPLDGWIASATPPVLVADATLERLICHESLEEEDLFCHEVL